MLLLLLSTALAKPPSAVSRFVHDPWTELDRSGVPAGLQPVMLSNIADGCARDGDAECVRVAVEVVLDPRVSPWQATPADVRDLDGAGLYVAHAAMVLAAARDVGIDEHGELHARLARQLHRSSMADRWHNPPSYRGDSSRWPADQAAALYALHRYDPALADEAFAAWKGVLDARGTDADTGLPVSELTGKYGYSATPRGCALFWSVGYLAAVDPDYARALWDVSSAQMAIRTPLGPGMREYPAGRERGADFDSGPIVMGIGAAASAFAVGAAHSVGDADTAQQLVYAEGTVREWAAPLSGGLVNTLLPESIRYRWFPPHS